MRLIGEVAVVTGSTAGIGRGIAEVFAANGARTIVSGRNVAAGQEVVAGITAAGGDATFLACDVSDETQVEGLITGTLERYGTLSILVNNAAPTDDMTAKVDGPVTDLTTERWHRLLAVGLDGVFWCCKYALIPMMRAGRGSVINISSGASLEGIGGLSAYAAMKGAMNSLTRAMAVDYAAFGIRCNTVVPGWVPVPRGPGASQNDPTKNAAYLDLQLMRPGRPDDIANAALYLASHDAEWVTGQLLVVDGGAQARSALPPVIRPNPPSDW